MIKLNLTEYYDSDYESQFGDEPGMTQPNQKFSSAKTSINKSKLPALFKLVNFRADTINLDVGGGKYDNVAEELIKQDVVNLVYDPYNRTSSHNTQVIKQVRSNGGADTVTCSNVLNVIAEPEARLDVIKNCNRFLKSGGTAYFTVYDGNKSGTGKQSGEDQYQTNMPLNSYVDEIAQVFDQVTTKGKLIIAK